MEAGGDTLFPTEELLEKKFEGLTLSRPRSSTDDAREFGGWAVDKLEILRIYLTMYRRVAGNGTYVDGFAGTGTIRSGGSDHLGSAALAINSGAFKSLRFYERPKNAKLLTKWLDDNASPNKRTRAVVTPGDFNRKILLDLENDTIPRDRPCFAFLDPNSTQLNWSTVEALARYKSDCTPPESCKVELWILFNTWQALLRLMPTNGKQPSSDGLNRWLGGEEGWRDLYEGGRGPTSFASRYAQRLQDELGYGLARTLIIRDPKNGRPQYHMIHASDHPAAHKFMRWAANKAHPDDSTAVSFPGMGT